MTNAQFSVILSGIFCILVAVSESPALFWLAAIAAVMNGLAAIYFATR